MNVKDENQEAKIVSVSLFVFEGDIERDADGNITNKLREVITHDSPDAPEGSIIPIDQIRAKVLHGKEI